MNKKEIELIIKQKYREAESEKDKIDLKLKKFLRKIIYENNFYKQEYVETANDCEQDVIDVIYIDTTRDDVHTENIECATTDDLMYNILYYIED